MRGRKPKATRLKLVAGNPGKRPLNDAEPQLSAQIPECPRHLDEEAKREWARITRELLTAGLLTQADRAALAAYCQQWSRWVKAEEELQKEGEELTAVRGTGGTCVNPLVTVSNQALGLMHKFLAEFGMTPSSRTRVRGAKKPEEKNAKGRFFKTTG